MRRTSRATRSGPPVRRWGALVSEHVYRVIEVVGSSPTSVDDAIRSAIARVAATTRGLDWFEVSEIRGHIEEGEMAHIQVGLKVGFRIEDTSAG